MFYIACLLAIGLGIKLVIVGAKSSRGAREYEFENRTDGGIVRFESLRDADRHHMRKKRAELIGSVGVILTIAGIISLIALIKS